MSKKVMVFGTFDIIHKGHLHFLAEAKNLGDLLVVIVARDATVKELKGELPWNNEHERLRNIKMSGLADTAKLGSTGDKHRVIREEKPDIIALGYDQRAFTENLDKIVPDIKIVRLSAYQPEKYKSSKIKQDQRRHPKTTKTA